MEGESQRIENPERASGEGSRAGNDLINKKGAPIGRKKKGKTTTFIFEERRRVGI